MLWGMLFIYVSVQNFCNVFCFADAFFITTSAVEVDVNIGETATHARVKRGINFPKYVVVKIFTSAQFSRGL